MTNKYEIILWWEEADNCYVAEVPELPGCMAHGDSEEQALKEIKIAIELWIETAQANNEPIPKPKGKKLIYT